MNLVNQIIPLIQSNADKNVCATVKEYKKQIDKLVYQLYGLTDEEIAIVEGKTK